MFDRVKIPLYMQISKVQEYMQRVVLSRVIIVDQEQLYPQGLLSFFSAKIRIFPTKQLASSRSIYRALETDCGCEPFLTHGASEQSRYHQVKPEDMQASEAAHESELHVQHWIVHVLARLFVAFFVKPPNNITGEVPKSEIDPCDQHRTINTQLNDNMCDIDRQFEKSDI